MTRIETYRVFGLFVALASGGALVGGCSDENAGAGTGGKGGGSGTATMTGGTAGSTGAGTGGAGGSGAGGDAVTYCMAGYKGPLPVSGATISDFDGEGGLNIQAISPGGVWRMDADASPGGGNTIAVESCGTTGNGLHIKGAGYMIWGAGPSAAMVGPDQPANVSTYSGISFVAKSATATPFLFKLQNPYSVPACGRCDDANTDVADDCYSGYTKGASTTTDTTPTVVKFADLTQQAWGFRPPGTAAFDTKNFISIAFAFDKGVDFDACLDDIKLIP